MGPYPRNGVEALLELALASVDADHDNRPQMIDVVRDLEIIMRDTVAPDQSASSQSAFSKGASPQGSSFHKVSESGTPKKTTFNIPTDLSWRSADNSRSQVNVEMEPR